MTAVDDIFRVAARLKYGNDDFVNVFHFKALDACTEAETVDGLLEAVEAFYTPIIGVLHVGMAFIDIKVDQVIWQVGKEVIVDNLGIWAWPTHTLGTASGDALPSGAAALITAFTQGVKTYGRKFLGRLTEGLCDSDGNVSAAMTSLGNASQAYIDDFTDSNAFDWQPVVHSLRSSAWLPFVSALVKAVISYQRRRKPGVGS